MGSQTSVGVSCYQNLLTLPLLLSKLIVSGEARGVVEEFGQLSTAGGLGGVVGQLTNTNRINSTTPVTPNTHHFICSQLQPPPPSPTTPDRPAPVKYAIFVTGVLGCSLSIVYTKLNKITSATSITIAANINKLISAVLGAYIFKVGQYAYGYG